jgi:histidinol dehydrogenase
MQVFKYPEKEQWGSILARPNGNKLNLEESTREILKDVKANGDKALKKYTKALDYAEIDELQLDYQTLKEAEGKLPASLKEAINFATKNIADFHKAQLSEDIEVETAPGVICSQSTRPIENIGIYIPGGTAPLFSSVLMLAVPAKAAGCENIVLTTPPDKNGDIDPAILYAASVNGVDKIYKVGGAQAIAAMAYGTETIPRVDKIFGPGNQYVTKAKQMVNAEGTAIDMPAGPSEVLVIADESTPPSFVASDLLAQAEHGPDSQVLFLTKNEAYQKEVEKELDQLLKNLPRKEVAEQALANSKMIILKTDDEMMEMSNLYAPEHLIIATKNSDALSFQVKNAGSVFLGAYTPESLGDYASGTNHVLPTNGFAKAYEGVNIDAFVKKITFQKATREGLEQMGEKIMEMASAEKLEAHRLAVEIRLQNAEKL